MTDRRMFTPEGELREEFQQFEKASAGASEAAPSTHDGAPPVEVAQAPTTASSVASEPLAQAPPSPMLDEASEAPEPGTPGFFDLIRLLAEHASIYLTEARDASPQEASHNLELARLHIELLAVLQNKTKGNLNPSEEGMLQDAIYQLRAGYAGVQG